MPRAKKNDELCSSSSARRSSNHHQDEVLQESPHSDSDRSPIRGAWQAVRQVFPTVEIKGCAFHWTQAVYRRVQELGLAATYRERESVYRYVRQLLALPFLPANHIREAFNTLKERANTSQLSLLVDYIESQWMENSVFPVASWSVYNYTVRTNNDIEAETPIIPKAGVKRPAEEDPEFSMEMQKMLECFGVDITKTLLAKRKRLEQLTQTTMKNNNKKVDDIWNDQQKERDKLQTEYNKQISTVFQQWESDVEKTKEQEEKLTNLFKQQQKLFQQARIVQSQRLKTIRQLHEQFSQGLDNLEQCHQNQQTDVQTELKKEMSLLQKRILMDTQQQEMMNVRKSLQTMLF